MRSLSGSRPSGRCPIDVPARFSSSPDPPRADECSVHPGLSIPVSTPPSAAQWLAQLVEPAEKDGLPRIPREQPKDEATTRAHHVDGNQHERLKKRFEFHAQHGRLLGRVASGPPPPRGQPQRN